MAGDQPRFHFVVAEAVAGDVAAGEGVARELAAQLDGVEVLGGQDVDQVDRGVARRRR
jgi:hypothetical protein